MVFSKSASVTNNNFMLCTLTTCPAIVFTFTEFCFAAWVLYKKSDAGNFDFYHWLHWLQDMETKELYTFVVGSFPGLPRFCSSVCVQYNTRKWKSFHFRALY